MNVSPLILVTGSRNLVTGFFVWNQLDRAAEELLEATGKPPILVHGGARGADGLAATWGRRELLTAWVEVFPADWNRLGKSAGTIRNLAMAERAYVQQAAGGKVVVLAFPMGPSPGTRHMMRHAELCGLTDIRVFEGKQEEHERPKPSLWQGL